MTRTRWRGTLVALTMLGCAESATGPVRLVPAAIRVNVQAATLESLGDTLSITAEVVAADGSPIPESTVRWRIEGDSVLAPINTTGSFVATTNGRVRVWAELSTVGGSIVRGNGYVADDIVTSVDVVVRQRPRGVSLAPSARTLWSRGDDLVVTATIIDARGNLIPLVSGQQRPGIIVSWSTSDASIATISDGGVVRALSDGAFTVRLRIGPDSTIAGPLRPDISAEVPLAVSSIVPVDACITYDGVAAPICSALQLTVQERN